MNETQVNTHHIENVCSFIRVCFIEESFYMYGFQIHVFNNLSVLLIPSSFEKDMHVQSALQIYAYMYVVLVKHTYLKMCLFYSVCLFYFV